MVNKTRVLSKDVRQDRSVAANCVKYPDSMLILWAIATGCISCPGVLIGNTCPIGQLMSQGTFRVGTSKSPLHYIPDNDHYLEYANVRRRTGGQESQEKGSSSWL